MKCPICSKEVKDHSKFCEYCGKKIPRCPKCGAVITKKMRFCVYDGTELPPEIVSVFDKSDKAKNDAVQMHGLTEVKSEPKKKSKKPWILLLILLLLAGLGVGGFFAWKYVSESRQEKKDSVQNDSSDSDLPKGDEENEKEGDSPKEEPTEEAEAPKEEPTEEAEAPKEEPAEETKPKKVKHHYEVLPSDMSWEDAKVACKMMGGYLATITSLEEYNEICELASESGLTYLWIGGYLDEAWDDWADCQWITGEDWGFENWYPGEPSMVDADGTRESYLCLWNAKYEGQSIGWTFNDQRNDIVEMFPSISGKLGFICEYEIEVNE